MSTDVIEKTIQAATMSLAMEGLSVDEQYIDLCRQMLMGEISPETYLATVIEKVTE